MEISVITQTLADGTTADYVIIDRGNGEFTSMPKLVYDAQQANQSLPSNTSTPQAGE